jgi:phosphoribosylamine--glycine ligase
MKKDIMVVGGGGREHAIIRALKKSPEINKIYALPGNAGMSGDAECVNISATDIKGVVEFAMANNISFAVVSPDDPLVLGMVDELESAGIPAFGPSKTAAQIEGSKVFAKNLMKKYRIPTAEYNVFSEAEKALEYVKNFKLPVVIKADGLALGKGVIIAGTRDDAENAVISIMKDKIFGKSGNSIVIEEFLSGVEVTVLTFTDGNTIVPMVSSMDHKKAFDGDLGPNTGGMGAVSPNPYYTNEIAERCMTEIFLPTVSAMKSEGIPFKGCLYFGLMITAEGVKVIEYNCRFGDPEAQAVLPLLETDLFEIMKAVHQERLDEIEVKFRNGYSCCVAMASRGYPVSYEKGFEITVGEGKTGEIYFAGTAFKDGLLVTNGGRVLGITNVSDTLEKAIEMSYNDVKKINFKNAYYRTDIGRKALLAREL